MAVASVAWSGALFLIQGSAMAPPEWHESHATRHTLFLRLRPDAPAREYAWREFHEIYAPIIAGFARKMGAREQDVADLVQDVLLGFFSASPKFAYDPARGRFRGYLKTCTWRAFQQRFGTRLRGDQRDLADIDAGELCVDQAWNDVWEGEKLQQALDCVREEYVSWPERAKTFQAFEMYVLLERPADEVAAELGMSVDSVHQAKSRISRAIRAAMEQDDI
jgi:RNA polymerase sigma-70 factor (ECF subfamily)